MKDKTARVLAIIALVFELIFIVTLVATVIDHKLLNGSIGYIALCSGVFVAMCLIALKADGRGFSMTKINNDIEMAEIENKLKEQKEKNDEKNVENKPVTDDKAVDEAEELKTPSDGTNSDEIKESGKSADSSTKEIVDDNVAVTNANDTKKRKK